MPDKYFDVNGVATLVHHRGPTTLPGSPPSLNTGHPILFLHDAGVNGNSFSEVMDLLMVEHSPISLDFPGHGRSGSLDSLATVEAMAAHIESLLIPWGLSSLTIVAEGLGAAVGVQIATNGALPLSSLICVGAVGPFVSLESEIEELTKITSGKARRQFDTSGYAPNPDEKMMRRAFGNWVTTDPRATLGARKAQADWNQRVDVSDCSCPTIIVIGDHTEAELKASSMEFAEQLAAARIVSISSAGRRSAQEAPSELCDVIVGVVVEGTPIS